MIMKMWSTRTLSQCTPSHQGFSSFLFVYLHQPESDEITAIKQHLPPSQHPATCHKQIEDPFL